MSAAGAGADAAKSASKKKKKNKKKANGTATTNGPAAAVNGATAVVDEEDNDENENEEDEAVGEVKAAEVSEKEEEEVKKDAAPETKEESRTPATTDSQSSETTARLDAMQQERDNLRAEVSELRKSLESLQEKHSEEISTVKEELEQTQQSKEHAETQYRNLLGKVNTIRSQLGERLKADAAELEEKRGQIEELEANNASAKEENEKLQASIAELNAKLEAQSSEVEALRSRSSLSTNNFAKERDELLSREAFIKEEYEVAKQAMQDWEILATEERSRREALEERLQETEEQLQSQTAALERVRAEVETQNSTVDGLQRALRDLQEERKKELREMVEQSQAQLDVLTSRAEKAESETSALRAELETTKAALERAEPFEKEVKEKNLLIGKLRHEAVILNDHLTKALRFLKRGRPEDNVDRQLVTNHLLHFLQLDRSDPKKFQVLQLIAALLAWDEPTREKAGLVKQGSASTSLLGGNAGATGGSGSGVTGSFTGSLRAPLSPFRRTPSTPAFGGSEFGLDSPGAVSASGKESLAELWSEFLDREAEAGSATSGSRRPSLALSTSRKGRSPSLAGLFSPTAGDRANPIDEEGEKETETETEKGEEGLSMASTKR